MHRMKNSRKRFLFEGDEKKRVKIETPHAVSVLRLWTIQNEEVVRLLLRSPCVFGMCVVKCFVFFLLFQSLIYSISFGVLGSFFDPFSFKLAEFSFLIRILFYASLKLGFVGCYFFRVSN